MCNAIKHDNQQGKTRDLFKRVKEITGDFTPRLGIVKSKGGRTLQEEEKIKARWKTYTKDLYKRDGNITDLFEEKTYEMVLSITHSNIRKALHDIKYNKSPESDKIPVKLLKESGDKRIEIFTSLCQKI